jgi:microcystin-dependent protein
LTNIFLNILKIQNKNIMEAFIGTICAFGFNYAPYGWQYCNGQILPISSYTALFSLLGTYYGGNGTSTFGLPNLQGRAAIHMGQHPGGSLYTIGETGGVSSVSVLISNMPAHAHPISMTIKANNPGFNQGTSPVSAYPSATDTITNIFQPAPPTPNTFMKPATVTIGAQGGNIPVTIDDPSLVMNYCIAMQGIFPTRN